MSKNLLFALAVALFLASCGGGSGTTTRKTFTYNQAGGIESLDPIMAEDLAKGRAVSQVYNGLFELNANLEAVPCLAEDVKISANERVYTFKLREGVFFHDNACFPDGKGRELVAEDFVYTFKRVLGPESLGSWIFRGKVLTDSTGAISDTCFKAEGKYTFKIYLDKPFGPFKHLLTMPFTYVIPKEAVEKYGKDYGRNPVGTGPFMLEFWDSNKSLVLKKNENYWKKDEKGNKLPYLDVVQIKFLGDKAAEFAAFEKGELDLIFSLDDNGRSRILDENGKPTAAIEAKYQVQVVPYLTTEYIGFQLDPSLYSDKKHPFLDKRVRQAMNYAIDRKKLVSHIRHYQGTPADAGFIPNSLKGYNPQEVKGYTYDPEKARILLKEAGFAGGKGIPEVTFYTNPDEHSKIAEFLKNQWEEVGIKVKIQQNIFPTHKDLVKHGKCQLFRGGWIADYPEEENFFSLFYSGNIAPVGPNDTRFSNQFFDQYFLVSQLEIDPAKRLQYYNNMDKILLDEAPVVILYYDNVLRVCSKRVKNFVPDKMNSLKLEIVDIDESAAPAPTTGGDSTKKNPS